MNIRPESHKENTLTFLRHTIIGRVNQACYDVILTLPASGFVLFQTAQMFKPLFTSTSHQARVLKLQLNVVEVIVERSPGQTFDILKHKSFGLNLTNSPNGLWEHVSLV